MGEAAGGQVQEWARAGAVVGEAAGGQVQVWMGEAARGQVQVWVRLQGGRCGCG